MKAVKGVERYATDDLRVSFAKTYAAGEALFALTENGYTIQMVPHLTISDPGVSVMALAPTENKVATVTNAEKRPMTERFDTIEEAAEIDNKSVIVYENVKTNTDLEYVLDGNDVKENIIVKRAGGSYVYRFTLTLTGLTVYGRTILGYAIYNNNPVYIGQMHPNKIYLLSNNRELNALKKTATHELGHALGYSGHSATSTDVMFGSAHSNY